MTEIHVQTSNLQSGLRVVTSTPIGDDFEIPLVEPTTRQVRKREVREVKSVVGGVVRFTDGAKSRRLHGRTTWQIAREPE